MAETTVHKWPYPLGTDLVVDGDNAIRSIAEGLETRATHLITRPSNATVSLENDGRVTFRAGNGDYVQLQDIFTSEFQAYRIFLYLEDLPAGTLSLATIATGGITEGSSSYSMQRMWAEHTTFKGDRRTAGGILWGVAASRVIATIDVFNPTSPTVFTRFKGDFYADLNNAGTSTIGTVGANRTSGSVDTGLALKIVKQGTNAESSFTGWAKVVGV